MHFGLNYILFLPKQFRSCGATALLKVFLMISRYFMMGKMPELRLEPQGADEEKPAPEIEVALKIDDYWDLTSLLSDFRYAKESGQPTKVIWNKITKIIMYSIISERDRTWFTKQRTGS